MLLRIFNKFSFFFKKKSNNGMKGDETIVLKNFYL